MLIIMNVYNFFFTDIKSEELFAFLGLCIVSGVLRTRMEPVANLWTTNAANATLIFHATTAKYQFYRILRVIHFNDKTTRNQQRSTDILASIRDVFESIISRFQMTNIPNEHTVVFRGKCPLCVFTKSKPGKYRIKL